MCIRDRVGVPEFINEWVSADYPAHQEDRETIRGGLGWLNTESFKRFSRRFEELGVEQQAQIADDICGAAKVSPEHHVGAVFFKRFRQLCVGGYYSHSQTWKSLGYVGNISIGGPYPGGLPEVIGKLGLQDVVLGRIWGRKRLRFIAKNPFAHPCILLV